MVLLDSIKYVPSFRLSTISLEAPSSHPKVQLTNPHLLQDPGRVFPGKKMAGRMGGRLVTTQNLLVHRIDTVHNVIYVRGAVPGPPGGFVRVTDALKAVGWKAGERSRKGLNKEGEILNGVSGLPMPVGDVELAKRLPGTEFEMGSRIVPAPGKA